MPGSCGHARIEHMIESLERALAVVQRAFEDATAGVAAGLDGPEMADLAAVVLAAQRVVNAASAVQAVGLAGIAARDEVQAADGRWVAVDRGPGFVGEFAAVSVAPMLGTRSRIPAITASASGYGRPRITAVTP